MGLLKSDLGHLVDTIIEIDSYKSKMGEDSDIVTLAFSVHGNEPAKDLENFIDNSWMCNRSKSKNRETKTVQGLIKALSAPTREDDNLNNKAREYYLRLNKLRNVDYWTTFPHLEYLNE